MIDVSRLIYILHYPSSKVKYETFVSTRYQQISWASIDNRNLEPYHISSNIMANRRLSYVQSVQIVPICSAELFYNFHFWPKWVGPQGLIISKTYGLFDRRTYPGKKRSNNMKINFPFLVSMKHGENQLICVFLTITKIITDPKSVYAGYGK